MKKIITILISLTLIFTISGCKEQKKLNLYDIDIVLNEKQQANKTECILWFHF